MTSIRFSVREGPAAKARAPLLVAFGFEGEGPSLPSGLDLPASARKDFEGKARSTLLVYGGGSERLLLVGLGKKGKCGAEEVRRAAAVAVLHARKLKVPSYAVHLDGELSERIGPRALALALAEGTVLGAYRIGLFRTGKEEKEVGPESVEVLAPTRAAAFQEGVEAGRAGAEAQNYARTLANRPANTKTPSFLAAEANRIARETGAHCRVLTERDMDRLGMGALLGVARGSAEPPRLIVLRSRPAKERIAIVGKGITFDSGGISLKPPKGMEEMKYDMSGGAAILGLFRALPTLGRLPFEVVGVIPATENLPGGRAQKPGDLATACNGKTIEVLNTDAEGRLILADALAWTVKEFAPKAIVDVATLTGAVIVALGHEASGVVGTDRRLVEDLRAAGEATGERLWELPLWEEHREQMKGEVADLRNINSPNDGGGTIAGAAFLSYFVGDTPWAHLDIAGTAWGGKDLGYYKKGASGVGVRLFLEFLRARAAGRK
ncbi:MAG TPA: leucyl aminopeptidase [Planctomycetota bacterium]|jgi:leucyl aminopeptidase|nr:leucyl aminopeptidase [Planctomycetota bacterium]